MSATSKPTYISLTSSNPGKIKALIVSRLIMSVAFDTVHLVQTIGDAKKKKMTGCQSVFDGTSVGFTVLSGVVSKV